jgi:UDP:flavonoid glycosyltransferase YjiC (YdhE family)
MTRRRRIILTSQPYFSHLVPVLQVAEALRDNGHTVAVATASAMGEQITSHGIEHLVLPHVRTLAELVADNAFGANPGLPEEGGPAQPKKRAENDPGPVTTAFAGPLAGLFARDLIEAAGSWRPEVILRECNEFGGYLAAERLALPRAVLDIAPFTSVHLPFLHGTLNAQRVEFGLDTVADDRHANRGLLAGLVPARWYPESLVLPSLRTYQPDPATGVLDRRFAELPDDRPLVLAGLGTVAPAVVPQTPKLLAAMVAALGELPCTAVVSLGGMKPEDWTGPRPSTVHLAAFTPQRLLLDGAALLLAHAGFGGVREAMYSGTPMVNLPLFADQLPNAGRVEELGLGLRVDPGTLDVATLAQACERVLADSAFRHRAAGASRLMRSEPGYDVLAEDLAALA